RLRLEPSPADLGMIEWSISSLHVGAGQVRPRIRAAVPRAGLGGLAVGRADREALAAARAVLEFGGARHAVGQREAGERRAIARAIDVVVDEVRLFRGCRVAGVRRNARVEAACAVGRELRDGDGREDADDRDHDQELDQSETLRLLPFRLATLTHSVLLL